MVDRDIVDRAGHLLDAAVMVIPSRREGWQTAYCVRVRGARAVQWMERLRPLMGIRRQQQIDRAIASHGPDPRRLSTTSARPRRWPACVWAGTHAHIPRAV